MFPNCNNWRAWACAVLFVVFLAWTAPAYGATTVTLTASSNSVRLGQPVTFTATVSPASATGKVTFYDGAAILGTATIGSGAATFTTNLLGSGSHSLRAYYLGDGLNGAVSSETVTQTITSVQSLGFGQAYSYTLPSGPYSHQNAVFVGDLNGDLRQDLVVANNDTVDVLLGNGDGTFRQAVSYPAPSAFSVLLTDWNLDGRPDLLVFNYRTGGITLRLGNGDGTFGQSAPVVTNSWVVSAIAGDFNGDGRPDLAVYDAFATPSIEVLLGNGDGTFKQGIGVSAQSPNSLQLGDFNGDGKTDIIFSMITGGVGLLLGNGDGTFRPQTTIFADTIHGEGVLVADLNGDGKLDFLYQRTNYFPYVFLGQGDGTFQPSLVYAAVPVSAIGDVEGDGLVDLFSAYNGNLYVVSGTGGGAFVNTSTSYPVPSGAGSAAIGDFNGDGKLDAVVTGTDNAVRVLLGTPSAAPPSKYVGWVDDWGCDGMSGWAADRNRIGTSIMVTLWDGNTQIASTLARGYRSDSSVAPGDEFHGFVFHMPAGYSKGVYTLQVRFESSTSQLTSSPVTLTCGMPAVNYTGSVDSAACTGITGWAADKSRLNTPITVSLQDGSAQIASTIANASRSDIGGLLGDNGLHGFSIAIPSAYANGAAHSLQVRYETSSTQLPGSPVTLTCNSNNPTAGLAFYPVAPCRIADTRAALQFTGAFGPPSMPGLSTRTFPILASACGIPATAVAYSLNFTVVPPANGPQANLTTWPTGLPSGMPNVSTLNYSSKVVANAAIVPAGSNGSIDVLVNYPTDVLFDINGYFAPPLANGLDFFPITPCRIADTRGLGFSGAFGPPSIGGLTTRLFDPTASPCGIPSTASAYSLNFTVVPPANGPQANLTTWPASQPNMPNVSTLNYAGNVVANAAIVPAGTTHAIDVFVNYPTDVLFDTNGYFGPPATSGLHFYPVTPCRVADTRAALGFTGAFGPPSMGAVSTRTFNIPSSACGIPASAVAYSLNFTVVPPANGQQANLTTWPTGLASGMPNVSTLNYAGSVVANAAIVPAGTNGSINVFVNFATDILFDINGYSAP